MLAAAVDAFRSWLTAALDRRVLGVLCVDEPDMSLPCNGCLEY